MWSLFFRFFSILLLSGFLFPVSVFAATYYVATSGSNSNTGTFSSPWLTIQYAVDQLTAGDTVFVRTGTYNEAVTLNVSGSASNFIYVRAYPNEKPKIDGGSLTIPNSDSGLFLIKNKNYIVIDGFELANYSSNLDDRLPVGIFVTGDSHHIQLRNNHIHTISSTASAEDANAHGIAVYGTNNNGSIHDLIISGNELNNLTLGNSEALVLNGNVEMFQVTDNHVHDNNNIGIDLIGFEGTASNQSVDQARDGIVSDNLVYNIDSKNNPAYFGDRSAGGIYVDGGTNITIERNRIYQANIGIEIASEHQGKSTSHITVRNNLIYHSHLSGISMGGYDTNRGSTAFCSIINNTLFQNDSEKDGNGELSIQYDTHDNVIKNNIMVASDEGLLISNTYTSNVNNDVDYNLYYTSLGINASEWEWKDQVSTGFSTYKTASGNDSHSLFVDPMFVNSNQFDFHLLSASPAIDKAASLISAGNLDIDQEARQQNTQIDLGSDEYSATSAPSLTLASNQWKQISLPCYSDTDNSILDVFGDELESSTYGTGWVLYQYDPSSNSYINPGLNGQLNVGEGYWMIQVTGSPVLLDVPSSCLKSSASVSPQCSSSNGCFEYPLATKTSSVQWVMGGNPFRHSQTWNNLRIATTTATCADSDGCTLAEATAASIFENRAWRYNATLGAYNVLANDAVISPWDAFWMATLESAEGKNPRLIIP